MASLSFLNRVALETERTAVRRPDREAPEMTGSRVTIATPRTIMRRFSVRIVPFAGEVDGQPIFDAAAEIEHNRMEANGRHVNRTGMCVPVEPGRCELHLDEEQLLYWFAESGIQGDRFYCGNFANGLSADRAAFFGEVRQDFFEIAFFLAVISLAAFLL